MINLLDNSPYFTDAIKPSDLTKKALGTLGESAVARVLRGALSADQIRNQRHSGDITLVSPFFRRPLNIEVKTASADKRGHFQFCLFRKVGNRVCTDIRHADLVVLLAVDDDFSAIVFVVPARDLAGKKKIDITHPKTTTGKYAQYREGGLL